MDVFNRGGDSLMGRYSPLLTQQEFASEFDLFELLIVPGKNFSISISIGFKIKSYKFF